MAIEIIRVTEEIRPQFEKYCLEFGPEHDSSFIQGRDLSLSEDHPSYVVLDDGELVGAVSLMRTENLLSIGKGRFSIFHSRTGKAEVYAGLLDAIRPHTEDLRSVYLFLPEDKTAAAGILKELGFEVERYSFILERGGPALPAPGFPEGMEVIPLLPENLEGLGQFVDCINEEFKDLAGHTPATVANLKSWFEDKSYLEDGICLLKDGQEAIGTISMIVDMDDPSAGEIMALGIRERYRGRDLGRNLFRYGFNFLIEKGLEPVFLAVNGENRGALRLYESEGFQSTYSVVCYSLDPGSNLKN